EWGFQNSNSSFIPETNEMSILLTDIDNDNQPNGGVIGFFYAKDNYNKAAIAGSNEKIMFYIDSIMYANDGGGDTWQKAVYATLAHEFTHMIEFYQKESQSAVWLAEMTAEATEYITSNSVQHNSPRGLPYNEGSAGSPKNIYDRYPDYNKYNNTLSLTPNRFLGRPEEYSQASAFGAFLVNNYGGPTVLHNIMHSAETSEQAIVDAVRATTGKNDITFGNILRDWGVAVLLSDKVINSTSDAPRYNTGDFSTTSYNGVDYNIGSINFFNYVKGHNPQNNIDTGPTIDTSIKTVMPHGNFFYRVGENLTGEVTINLNVTDNIEATLIAK
ncbi:MAG TPA: hypothetical protein EYG71_04950, partial [Leucothrix sp.]|nr:hypothetical protein [Leucothrix sp.]